MSYWGKVIGGVAGLMMGGPFGAVMGAALGHAADNGGLSLPEGLGSLHPVRLAGLFARREQMLGVTCVVLAARLAKVDAPVNRREIDAFKRHFRIAPDQMAEVARLFDRARDGADPIDPYARELGQAYAGDLETLEEVLAALFAIARADGPLNAVEESFLRRVARGFGLQEAAWDRARGAAAPARKLADDPDPYQTLGVRRIDDAQTLRAAWKRLVRENHPDLLAARGADAAAVQEAGERVARINAAWDRIKRERQI
jgi:DnaJ like chaperone protein